MRMVHAVSAFDRFVTPMAAVAGAVADEILHAMRGAPLTRAYANDGGDIAVHLTPGTRFRTAICDHANREIGRIDLSHAAPYRGIATSGRHGRSHSLGIADSVTVLAPSAAEADAAATLIANAVDLPDHPSIRRTTARDLDPDSDLGARPVTTAIGPLTTAETDAALRAGLAEARAFGLPACLSLNGRTLATGPLFAQPTRAAA